MPDTRLIRTFLDPQHAAFAERAGASRAARSRRAPRRRMTPSARPEARALLALLSAGGWLQPIFDLDLRGCCLVREALGEASPLADAVFALQALGHHADPAGRERRRRRTAGSARSRRAR